MDKCTRNVVGHGFFDPALPEPRKVIGPPYSYRTLLYYRTTPLGSLLSDPHRPTELSDHNEHTLLSD